MKIGFIGVGVMGHGMAANILAKGHSLITMAHRNRQPVEDLVALGANEAADLAGIASDAEIIILCVTNSRAVESVIAGLKPHLRQGQIIIDTSTSEPELTRKLVVELDGLGVRLVDAPLTGGATQAANGELGAMVGADDETFAVIKPVLEAFCTRISHFGAPGAGHDAKLINNYLVFGMVSMIADTYNVARKANVDWAKLYNVMLCGSNNSEALRRIVGQALEGNFEGYQFPLTGAHKDMSYYMDFARARGLASDLAETVMADYERALAEGHGDLNVSRMIDPALSAEET